MGDGGCGRSRPRRAWSGVVAAASVVAAVVAVMVAAGGCAPPGRSAVTPAELARAWAVDCQASEEGPPFRVSDRHILGVLLGYLREARPCDAPGERRHAPVDLVFHLPGGGQARHRYLFDDLDVEEPGYLQVEDGWFLVPGEFNIVLFGLEGYPGATGAVDAEDRSLLESHGWTPAFHINTWTQDLPAGWRHRAGEYPEVLYWAYNNELNRDAGFDLTPALGGPVEVRLYKVAEALPDFMEPRREAGRAVIVRSGGRVVGAWLDAGRHWGFACSLRGRRFEEVTGKTWEEWIPGLIDPADPLEQELARLSPEELIRRYYGAIDRGDYRTAHACESRKWLASFLFANMDNRFLYNPGFPDRGTGGFANITSARVVSIRREERLERSLGYAPASRLYQVVVEMEVKEPVTFDSGRQTRFLTLRQETPATGWRIEAAGTGP